MVNARCCTERISMNKSDRKRTAFAIFVFVVGLLVIVRLFGRPLSDLFLLFHDRDRIGIPVALLLGADPNLQNEESLTPLMNVAYEGDAGTVELLLRCGADPNRTDRWGRNALSVASTQEVKRILLKAGAKPALHPTM